MMPFISTPVSYSPTPVQTSAVVGAPIESSIVRIPPSAVPTAFNPGNIQNNTRGSSALRSIVANNIPTLSPSTGSSGFYMVEDTANLPRSQFSSPFMAQLLSQASNPSEAASLASMYANDNIPTVDPELMEIFSLVKYMPSNASLPMAKPMSVATLNASQANQNTPQPEPVQTAAPQAQMEMNLAPRMAAPAPVLQMVSPQPQEFSRETSSRPAVAITTPAQAPRRSNSLVRETGVQAYSASTARNQVHLGDVKPPVEEAAKAAV